MELERIRATTGALRAEVHKVVVGQDAALDLMLVALLSDGHVLVEGVPGVAKTLLARAFATALGIGFNRIQFTPDLMPGDVIGTNLFNFQTNAFVLTKGPIFADVLLADEINRTPPKTQAALLQAMQERAVTIDGTTHVLSPAFMVIATQNPIEQEGTYPLPEAQLDRFLFKIDVGYPSRDEERDMVRVHGHRTATPPSPSSASGRSRRSRTWSPCGAPSPRSGSRSRSWTTSWTSCGRRAESPRSSPAPRRAPRTCSPPRRARTRRRRGARS